MCKKADFKMVISNTAGVVSTHFVPTCRYVALFIESSSKTSYVMPTEKMNALLLQSNFSADKNIMSSNDFPFNVFINDTFYERLFQPFYRRAPFYYRRLHNSTHVLNILAAHTFRFMNIQIEESVRCRPLKLESEYSNANVGSMMRSKFNL